MSALPPRITLPSGARVTLAAKVTPTARARARREGEPLFADVFALARRGGVAIEADGEPIDVAALPLADFHVLRAVLTKAGLVHEDEIEIACHNCGAALRVRPCAALEIGPWVDGELDDEELDATLPFGEAHEIEDVRLSQALSRGRARGRVARTVTFAPRTAGEAKPLFAALAKRPFRLTAEVVRAMGIASLGAETDAARVAEALEAADDDAFGSVFDAFVASHYAPRLTAAVICACGARSDVEAPAVRELDAAPEDAPAARPGFPSFEAFAARAEAIAEPLLAALRSDKPALVVEAGTPQCDAAGEPLLGLYETGRPEQGTWPTITVFYRSFAAEHDADETYDWDDDLRETIEHELDHHTHAIGDDETADAEHVAVVREAVGVVGRREIQRRELAGFAASLRDFFARTWVIWLLVAAAVALGFVASSRE